MAEKLVQLVENGSNNYRPIIDLDMPVEEKIKETGQRDIQAGKVEFLPEAQAKAQVFKKQGLDRLPVIVAKTQYSITDDEKKLGAPSGYTFNVRNLNLSAGAGFIVAVSGNILLMPGLGEEFCAQQIDVDKNGKISGLFEVVP